MSKVKTAIALSDLHLGSENSYFHCHSPKFYKNRKEIIAILQQIGKKDEIIINGDFLELSLAGLDNVYKDVKEFFSILAECDLYNKIVYIPGNHDHHFWRELVEQVYVYNKISEDNIPPGCDEYPHCFVDNRFSNKDTDPTCKIILTDLWPKNKPMPEIVVKYPHHFLRVLTKEKKEQYYLVTHGHFLEDLFKPMNYIFDPARLDELEAFNNIWLEAFDYHLGQSGRLADKVRKIVISYEKGGKEAKTTIGNIAKEIRQNLTKKLKMNWLKCWFLKIGFKLLLKKIPTKKESGLYKVSINDDLKESITEYINNYLLQRYQKGNQQEFHTPVDNDIPTPFTFVFGHTHRPVRELYQDNMKLTIQEKEYPLANTGGWLRTDSETHGANAGFLVIDQEGMRWESLEGRLE